MFVFLSDRSKSLENKWRDDSDRSMQVLPCFYIYFNPLIHVLLFYVDVFFCVFLFFVMWSLFDLILSSEGF